MEPLTDIETFKRLGLAMAAGLALGLERETADKPAGVRTFMLVCEGAALFMLCGLLLSDQLAAANRISDPGRIASTVIQGIGFIAAGVILTRGNHILGLTTAAGIWVTAAIGLLIGAGFTVLGLGATVITVVSLYVLREIGRHVGDARPPDSPHSDKKD
ncbi:MAG: MgtC/SapB family protein [Chloroflexota bacterium]|nr:MgtC/SapB family protein [Chloroflexota bacterium]